ncbi:hypothetical protein FRC01_002278 [Tulasnella sp. 417]|nr:hypothetical protein FRC01_002278 [Tulasnella sp. 417]
MKLSTLYLTSLALLPSFIAAAAIPEAAPRSEEASTIVKRAGEVNYIANCIRVNPYGTYEYYASYMAWYANQDNSQNGQWPDSLSNEYRNWANGGSYLDWTQPQSVYFSGSGVSVQSDLESWAWNPPVGTAVGWATRTSDSKKFTCYRDNDRQLFNWTPPVPDGTDRSILCYSAFWCN